MTSPRQKKKKLAILKMLKKQKNAAAQLIEKTIISDMNKNLLIRSENHANDQIDQKQTESVTEKNKLTLKEIRNKKLNKPSTESQTETNITDTSQDVLDKKDKATTE